MRPRDLGASRSAEAPALPPLPIRASPPPTSPTRFPLSPSRSPPHHPCPHCAGAFSGLVRDGMGWGGEGCDHRPQVPSGPWKPLILFNARGRPQAAQSCMQRALHSFVDSRVWGCGFPLLFHPLSVFLPSSLSQIADLRE